MLAEYVGKATMQADGTIVQDCTIDQFLWRYHKRVHQVDRPGHANYCYVVGRLGIHPGETKHFDFWDMY